MIGFQPEKFNQKTVKSNIRFSTTKQILRKKTRNNTAQWQRPEGATPWVNENI